MLDELTALSEKFPLPSGWRTPELFSEDLSVEGAGTIALIGLTVSHSNGSEIFSSAAQWNTRDTIRAYFELLERTHLINALQSSRERFVMRDSNGSVLSEISREDLFPQSPAPELWVYSKSNGVAAHHRWSNACRSAEAELIERDSVLASWFGHTVPERLPRTGSALSPLQTDYEIESYRFAVFGDGSKFEVVGSFGFPKKMGLPRFLGFAAASDLDAAFAKSENEALQNYGFLFGSPIAEEPVAFAPTPEYHQDYFSTASGIAELRAWLSGDHYRPEAEEWIRQRPLGPLWFADINLDRSPQTHIAKAVQPGRFPLYFGKCDQFADEIYRIHPIP